MTTTLTTTGPDVTALIDGHPKLAESTKLKYGREVDKYLSAGHSIDDPAALATYANALSKSSRSFLKAGVRLWTKHFASMTKAGATPDNVDAVTATLYRLDSINDAIQISKSKGQKAHHWLSQTDVKALLETCNTKTAKGRRDLIVLGVLTGAGLRREELANLTFDDIVLQGESRTVLNVTGKGDKDRIVPIRDSLAEALGNWRVKVGPGLVARRVTKGGSIRESLSPVGIFHIVRAAGKEIGKPDLAPHDLRRSFAELGKEAGVDIAQISTLLGHSSLSTTQRYLNLNVDLAKTVGDFVPFV